MATSHEEQASLKKIQELIAPLDPSIMELDPSNEDDAETIKLAGVLLAAMKSGESLTITTEDENGRTETVGIQPTGKGPNGEPIAAISIGSSDGTLAPETADLVAELRAAGHHQTEVNRLVGE